MPKFGKRSRTNINECHEDLQIVFNEVIKHFDCTAIDGHRPEVEQTKAYLKGNSRVQWPNSKHNSKPSMAADVIPYPIDWKDVKRMRYFAGFVVGIAHNLHESGMINHLVRWGGDWDKDTDLNDQKFNDLPHFELYKP